MDYRFTAILIMLMCLLAVFGKPSYQVNKGVDHEQPEKRKISK